MTKNYNFKNIKTHKFNCSMILKVNARANKRGTILKRSLKLIFQQANFNRYIVVERISSLACAREL